MLQRRLEDVEASNKRLEEDKAALKQENASLVSFTAPTLYIVHSYLPS